MNPPPRANPLFRRGDPVIARRGVHLDLKGLPPTPARLMQLLDLFAAARFNVVLVEWEDQFPWSFDADFRGATTYTPRQVDDFHRRAHELGLQVIPLVQSLGHMETPLRLPQYESLREVPNRCDGLNPLAPGARELVAGMIEDVLQRSPDVTHFHLGGDEAMAFGTHPATHAYCEQHGRAKLYLQHVEPLLDMLLSRGIRPILWHDMMHDWNTADLSRLGEKADLMFWSYQGHPDNAPPTFNSKLLARLLLDAGVKCWGAGAFKGADSRGDAELPDSARRVANAAAWANLAARHDLQGVVMTGWSRYSTHRPQCEPIDGALDVLLKTAGCLHDGDAPDDRAVEAALRALGERERFANCRAALARLAEARRSTWEFVRLWQEQSALERRDEHRRQSGVLGELRRLAREDLGRARIATGEVQRALRGLVPDRWIEMFIAERVGYLEEVLAD